MNREEVLKRAIEKAEKNGYEYLGCPAESQESTDDCYYCTIFSHDFAKAFWGENTIEICDMGHEYKPDSYHECPDNEIYFSRTHIRWQYHLQQMVISEDPIKYLEQFI